MHKSSTVNISTVKKKTSVTTTSQAQVSIKSSNLNRYHSKYGIFLGNKLPTCQVEYPQYLTSYISGIFDNFSKVGERRRHGGGASGETSPPPNLRSDTREIDADPRRFSSRKSVCVGGGRFKGFAPTFYMHRRYGGRSWVLRLRKKRELLTLLKWLLW